MRRSISKAQGVVDDNTDTKYPNMDEEFLVCNDASKEGLGIILMQDNLMITYTSRKPRRHDEKYTMHDSELLAIVYALRAWRHYLIR
jgi:hypothetical protein